MIKKRELKDRLERIEKLHKPIGCGCAGTKSERHCGAEFCQVCSDDYPCETVRMIWGENDANISTV